MASSLNDQAYENGQLSGFEVFWTDHRAWLLSCGYGLRPRYQPGWVASWLGLSNPYLYDFEDAMVPFHGGILDATRLSDGKHVMLKQVVKSHHPEEIHLARTFSSEPLSSDRDNRCVPIFDALDVPDEADMTILIMPLLLMFDDVPFYTFGEAMDFFDQIFRGLNFMHCNRYYHGDIKWDNLYMDGMHLYKQPPHPWNKYRTRDFKQRAKATQRTRRPVKYYFIDFGLTRHFPDSNVKPLIEPGLGGDQTVPEFKTGQLVDPFAVDVYRLGNLVQEQFLTGRGYTTKPKAGFEFIQDLIGSMVQDDPAKRPTMDAVVSRFESIKGELSQWKLRSRVRDVDEKFSDTIYFSIRHLWRTFGYLVTLRPSIPTPK